MAGYEHLPIYKKAFDLTVRFEKVAAGFSVFCKGLDTPPLGTIFILSVMNRPIVLLAPGYVPTCLLFPCRRRFSFLAQD